MNEDTQNDGSWQDADPADDDSGRSGSPSLAAIGGDSSIDDMARTLSTFGMRLDALVTSTTSYRSAITDRLVEYADTVNRLVKNQSADLEEHRSSNQRLLAELQSQVAASDTSVSSLAERIDDLANAPDGDAANEVLAEVRTILEAQERLGRFLTEALDQFGDRVTERLDQFNAVEALTSDMQALRETMVDLASGEVVGALWDEVRALRSDMTQGLVVEVDGALGDVLTPDETPTEGLPGDDRAEIRHLLTELVAVSERPGPDINLVAKSVDEMRAALIEGVDARPTPELLDQLSEIRSAVKATTARLDEGLVVDVSDNDLADGVAALRDEVTAELEAVRQILADTIDRPAPAAAAAPQSDDVEIVVDIDPIIDLVGGLRDEVRALGGLPAEVAESINAELVALRRRIKVRSEADVLTDDQLDRIAQAVADRLA